MVDRASAVEEYWWGLVGPVKPLCIDLFCELGGWSEGFLAEGWQVIGFDIEQHQYGGSRYPAQLVLQDVMTVHGSQFRNADCIVASPPCTEYSYMAMPWSRAKQIAAALREEVEFPEGYEGSRTIEQLNALFNACFRIQREACEAAGRHIPMVVENVKGAQPWVGEAKAHFGSFYFWGGIESVGGAVVVGKPQFGSTLRAARRGMKFNPDGTEHPQGSWFAVADSNERGANGRKVDGFNFHQHEKTGTAGGSFQTAAVNGLKGPGGDWFEDGRQGQDVTAAQRCRELEKFAEERYPELGVKLPSKSGRRTDVGNGARFTSRDCGIEAEGTKQRGSGPKLFDTGVAKHSSRSNSRKAASAQIAKIPFPLASYVARSLKPGALPAQAG